MYGSSHEVSYADFSARRLNKYTVLSTQTVGTMEWRKIHPDVQNCSFLPQDDVESDAMRRLDSVFLQFGAGLKTNRDAVVIGFDDNSLIEAVRRFDSKLVVDKDYQKEIHSVLYRPFDIRRIFYHRDVVASRSLPTMKHFIAGPNIGFVGSSTWTTPDRFSVSVSHLMVEMKTGTHDRCTTFFPLYRYESLLNAEPNCVHNFIPDFVKEWTETTRTRFLLIGRGDLESTSGPEDVLFWLYGLFYSPEYRRRH